MQDIQTIGQLFVNRITVMDLGLPRWEGAPIQRWKRQPIILVNFS